MTGTCPRSLLSQRAAEPPLKVNGVMQPRPGTSPHLVGAQRGGCVISMVRSPQHRSMNGPFFPPVGRLLLPPSMHLPDLWPRRQGSRKYSIPPELFHPGSPWTALFPVSCVLALIAHPSDAHSLEKECSSHPSPGLVTVVPGNLCITVEHWSGAFCL